MQPAIGVGDIVLISKVPIETIQKGDIIQYRSDNITIIHRVYDIYKEDNAQVFITKGDANSNPDDPILSQQIMGKAVFTLPKIGWIPITIKEFIRKFVSI
jgi:signal peptidase